MLLQRSIISITITTQWEKVGDRSWYKNDSDYEFARDSMLEMSVAKEITNVAQIKANATSNTDTAKKMNIKNLLLAAFFVFAVNILAWLIVIFKLREGIKKQRLGKKGEKIETIIKEFKIGEATALVVFILSVFVLKNVANPIQLSVLLIAEILSFAIAWKLPKRIFSENKK